MKARLNPFASNRVLQIRYELQHETWEQLLQRLTEFNYRAAILGPEGSGKTTLLEDLAERLRDRFELKWLALSADYPEVPDHFFSDIRQDHLLLVDGVDLLPAWTQIWLFWKTKKCRGLILTAHHSTRLRTLVECSTSPELLNRISHRLVANPEKGFQQLTHDLFRKHHGNLRDVFRELYDIWAVLP
jgi:energy-coupling factor transporter ATP-binding protein EcfA2